MLIARPCAREPIQRCPSNLRYPAITRCAATRVSLANARRTGHTYESRVRREFLWRGVHAKDINATTSIENINIEHVDTAELTEFA